MASNVESVSATSSISDTHLAGIKAAVREAQEFLHGEEYEVYVGGAGRDSDGHWFVGVQEARGSDGYTVLLRPCSIDTAVGAVIENRREWKFPDGDVSAEVSAVALKAEAAGYMPRTATSWDEVIDGERQTLVVLLSAKSSGGGRYLSTNCLHFSENWREREELFSS